MNKIGFSLCLGICIAICLCGHRCRAQECTDKGMRKFDLNFAKLITIANSGRKFPEHKGVEMKTWCSESDAYIKELEQYKSKCFKNLNRQVFGVLIYAIKNSFKQYCRRDSKKLDDLIAAVPCLNKHDDRVTKCYTTMIDGILGAKWAEDNKKIPHLCCVYTRVFECFDAQLSDQLPCNDRHVETISDLIRSIVGNVVDLICGDYTEGSDKCVNLGPPPKKKKTQRRSKSFATPISDLLGSFPEV